ncbi:uncharacterized protein LOC108022357 [Drosophila biarmipes]|uniref:uncharacterized protein LOC108022357 n=1 Tax=Drosophila biarmipes TaxID=125945 RepID=UPI0007E83716|nr:uncharacterized protein LOC108022357 [Drosophila biarmipes]
MSEEEVPGAGGEDSGAGPTEEVAAPVPDTTTANPEDTTTSGARMIMMMNHPWLAAGAVAVYATKVMWVKFRELGLAKQKKKVKYHQEKMLKPQKDDKDCGLESESEEESDTKPDKADLAPKQPI